MTQRNDTANTEMIEYWNEDGGKRFVRNRERLDAQIGPFGLLAIERGKIASGERVIDVGCGCGDTTLELSKRVGSAGQVTGIDVSEPMLEVAKQRAREAGASNVAFERADAQTATLPAEAFECAYSRFGVMFFDDPVTAFTRLRGALVPGGRVAFVCWQPLARNAWMLLPAMAAAKVLPMPAPPALGAPGPFAFGDDARVRDILLRAGFEAIGIESHESSMLLGGSDDLEDAVDLILEIGPLARALADAGADKRPAAAAAVREAIAPHATPLGVALGAAVWLVTARRP